MTRVFDGVLFDLDGVLVDSAASVERSWSRWAGERGLVPGEVIGFAHGHRTVETVRHFAPQLDAEGEAARIEREQVGDTAGVRAMPGAAELVADVAAAVPWAVVTSGGDAIARARLRAAGLPIPDVLVTAEAVRAGKPAPDGYRLGASRIGCSPARCAVVEDTVSGARAGKAAGAWVVRLVAAGVAGAAEADLVVDSLTRLRARPGGNGGVVLTWDGRG